MILALAFFYCNNKICWRNMFGRGGSKIWHTQPRLWWRTSLACKSFSHEKHIHFLWFNYAN